MRKHYADDGSRAIATIDVHPDLCFKTLKLTGYRPPTPRATLTHLRVPHAHRRSGVASRLLAQVCADADAEGCHLFLVALPDGDDASPGFAELTAFYEAHGFHELDRHGAPGFMLRPPLTA